MNNKDQGRLNLFEQKNNNLEIENEKEIHSKKIDFEEEDL